MVDVGQVVFNAMWVTGCAVILATFSHAHWLAHRQGLSARHLVETPAYRLSLLLGLGLRELSMQPGSLLEIKETVRNADVGRLERTTAEFFSRLDEEEPKTLLDILNRLGA